MLKALLKKQFSGMFLKAVLQKKGGKMQLLKVVGIAVLVLYMAGVFGGLFYYLMNILCEPLVYMGLDWLYFAYAALAACALAVVGSVFMAKSALFEAKDNELLLAMPIPPKYILLCRMIPLYVQTLLFEALALVPCFIVYMKNAAADGVGVSIVVFWAVLLLFLPLFALALCCVLGWVVALITSKMRSKNAVTVVLSLAFMALYFWGYMKINELISMFIVNAGELGGAVRRYLYPFYQIGLAAAGSPKALALAVLFSLLVFGAVYLVLALSFFRIVTSNKGEVRVRYKEKGMRAGSAASALFYKETKRFTGSAIYLLNGGLGTVLLAVGTVFLLIKGEGFAASFMAGLPFLRRESLSAMILLAACFMCSTNVVSASSVSLEGKNLWILQVLPVSPWQALMAKLKLHVVVTAPMAVAFMAAGLYVLKPDILMGLDMLLIPPLFVVLVGELGLVFNLHLPKLRWNNEAQVVKQSASVVCTMFAGYGILFALGVGAYALSTVSNWSFGLLACVLALLLADLSGFVWLKKKGVEQFGNLAEHV